MKSCGLTRPFSFLPPSLDHSKKTVYLFLLFTLKCTKQHEILVFLVATFLYPSHPCSMQQFCKFKEIRALQCLVSFFLYLCLRLCFYHCLYVHVCNLVNMYCTTLIYLIPKSPLNTIYNVASMLAYSVLYFLLSFFTVFKKAVAQVFGTPLFVLHVRNALQCVYLLFKASQQMCVK